MTITNHEELLMCFDTFVVTMTTWLMAQDHIFKLSNICNDQFPKIIIKYSKLYIFQKQIHLFSFNSKYFIGFCFKIYGKYHPYNSHNSEIIIIFVVYHFE